MAKIPLPSAPKSGEAAAPAGKEAAQLNKLIDKAEARGSALLYELTSAAVRRLLAHGGAKALTTPHLFNGEEMARLTDSLAAVIGTGSLLGHGRVRERMEAAELTKGKDFFSDPPFAVIQNEELPLLQPYNAIDYFKSLIPRLGVDPIRWAPLMQRTAFTLAAATEKTITEEVQAIILDRLRSGETWILEPDRVAGQMATGPAEIDKILTKAGVSPANPQYSQMVYRTNTMDAYNVGQQVELEAPDVKDFFPAWLYMGIADGRQGDDHAPRFCNGSPGHWTPVNKYYPNSLPFHVVRGDRVFNCRCTFSPIDKYKWKRLQASGVQFSAI